MRNLLENSASEPRKSFNDSWISESPQNVGNSQSSAFKEIEYDINDLIRNGQQPKVISNHFYSIVMSSRALYWYQENNDIIMGVEFEILPKCYLVTLAGKREKYQGKPPYISDIYKLVLEITNGSIRIMSDKYLSDGGYKIWKQLLKQGHKISVYDRQNPGKTRETFHTVDEMDKFISSNKDFTRYQYILSEATDVGDVISQFHARRWWELTGLTE